MRLLHKTMGRFCNRWSKRRPIALLFSSGDPLLKDKATVRENNSPPNDFGVSLQELGKKQNLKQQGKHVKAYIHE